MTDQLALIPAGAVVCPACGGVEPNAFLLNINHDVRDGLIGGWPIGEHPIFGGYCGSQALRLSHIAYARKYGTPEQVEERIALARERGLTEKDWT